MITGLLATATLVAAFAFGWTLNQFLGMSQLSSGFASALLFIMAMQAHGGILRGRLKRVREREIDTLKDANVAIRAELTDTRQKMADVTTALAVRSDAQEKKVVGELQMLEGLIREFATNIARKSHDIAGHVDDEIQVAHQTHAVADKALHSYAATLAEPHMLETIRRSLEENRVDLYLQPTVSLPQRKVRFYEALSRLRSEDGTVIMTAQ